MNEALLWALMGWAMKFGDYPKPAELPAIQFVTHEFLVEHACYGVECKVVGWYNDESIVYLDDRYQNLEGAKESALVVHEFTHYLQDMSGYWPDTCEAQVSREREAYYVEDQYRFTVLTGLGRLAPVTHPCAR
jgi:hypothetical protein